MSIVKNILIISLITILTSCSGFKKSFSSHCKSIKASFDIGSGSTKMVVAKIDKCKERIDNVIFEASRAIGLKDHLVKNKNVFSNSFIYASIDQISELHQLAKNKGATSFNAVATQAFRTAKNSQAFKDLLKERLGLKVSIINQTSEALIAFKAAKSKINKENLLVWDIGGASMQIVKSVKDKKDIYLGKLASVSFKEKVLELLGKENSPNPLEKSGAIRAMETARIYASNSAKKIIGDIDEQYVIGVGGVHYFSIRNQTKKKRFYTQRDVLNTLLERSKLTDEEVGGDYAKTDVTNLALVLGYMQALGIERVYPMKINMAHGILLIDNSN